MILFSLNYINSLRPSDAYMRRWTRSSLFQIMACRLSGAKAIIWTNAGILLIGPLGTNFSDILIGIQTFSFKKLHLKTSSAKWHLFCLGLNELNLSYIWMLIPRSSLILTALWMFVWSIWKYKVKGEAIFSFMKRFILFSCIKWHWVTHIHSKQ